MELGDGEKAASFSLHPSSFILPRGEAKLGDLGGGETPGSIPNPAVKPASADGT